MVDALGLDSITLIGVDRSGPMAIDYVLIEPRRVSNRCETTRFTCCSIIARAPGPTTP